MARDSHDIAFPLIVGLVAVCAAGCAEITGDAEVAIDVEWPGQASAMVVAGATWDDVDLALAQASVELVPCAAETDDARVPTYDMPVAHTVTTPTRLGTPVVHGPSDDRRVGVMYAPAGDYCAVVLEWSPPDDDATGLDAHPMLGTASMRLRGMRDGAAVEWATTARASVRHDLDPPLTLATEHRVAIRHHLGLALARVTPTGDAETDARALMDALAATVEVAWR